MVIKISGSLATPDSIELGAAGNANFDVLTCNFDSTWTGLSKRLTFYNAHNEAPVAKVLGNLNVYDVEVPAEFMKYAGNGIIVFDGQITDPTTKIAKTANVTLVIPESLAPAGDSPADITPSLALQLDEKKVEVNSPIAAATKCKITYDAKGLVKEGADLDSDDLAANIVTSAKLSALANGKPFIMPGLIPPNYDTATKTLSFNSDSTYKAMLYYGAQKYEIPVGTTVVDSNGTTAVQLIFDTTNSTFSFIPHTTIPSDTQVRVAVYKRLAGNYYWDIPGALTVDTKTYLPIGSVGSDSLGSGSVTSTKVSELAYGKPYILIGLTPPNFDTATKTLAFNSDAAYKTMMFYKNLKYEIPVGTTVVDNNGTTAVQLIFDTVTQTFSFIPHSTAIDADTKIRVGVYKRKTGNYYWDFPSDITIDGKYYFAANTVPYSAVETEYTNRIELSPALYFTNDLTNVSRQALALETSTSVLSFAAISDLHVESGTYAQVMEHLKTVAKCAETGSIQFIACLGDLVSGVSADKTTEKNYLSDISRQFNKQKEDVMIVPGNHDDNAYYTTVPLVSNLITKEEWYTRAIRPFNNGAIHDSANTTSAYYYKDYENAKIRAIFLDGVDYPTITEVDGTARYSGRSYWGFGGDQIDWLATKALDFSTKGTDKSNWAAILICHIPTRASLEVYGDIPQNGDLVEGVLKAFHNGNSFTGSTSDADWGKSVSIDFTSQGAIEIIAYIHGHLHADNIQIPADLGWNYIAVPNSFASVAAAGDLPSGAVAPSPRTIGTDTEDCWDIFVINRATSTINIIRYGAGSNRTVSY